LKPAKKMTSRATIPARLSRRSAEHGERRADRAIAARNTGRSFSAARPDDGGQHEQRPATRLPR
jgi:hypothetical protein